MRARYWIPSRCAQLEISALFDVACTVSNISPTWRKCLSFTLYCAGSGGIYLVVRFMIMNNDIYCGTGDGFIPEWFIAT